MIRRYELTITWYKAVDYTPEEIEGLAGEYPSFVAAQKVARAAGLPTPMKTVADHEQKRDELAYSLEEAIKQTSLWLDSLVYSGALKQGMFTKITGARPIAYEEGPYR